MSGSNLHGLLGVAFVVMSCASASGEGDFAWVRGVEDGEINWGTCPEFFPAGCQIAVLHGDPTEPDADIYFRVPGGYDLPRHRHTSAARMLLLEGELHLTYEGQRKIDLLPGAYAYGPPQLSHEGRCVSEDPCLLFIAFEAPIDASADVAGDP